MFYKYDNEKDAFVDVSKEVDEIIDSLTMKEINLDLLNGKIVQSVEFVKRGEILVIEFTDGSNLEIDYNYSMGEIVAYAESPITEEDL